MKPRYYVQQTGNAWLVLDRLKIKMHNDVVMSLATRKEARAKAGELNNERRQDQQVDGRAELDGELI